MHQPNPRTLHSISAARKRRLLGDLQRSDGPTRANRNVDGTRHVLLFAEELHARGRLRRVDHFSTAFVAGNTPGRVYEDRLDATQFNNTYEQWEAEQVVRAAQRRLPITIHRPSIIVGDLKTGYTSNFRALYRWASAITWPRVPSGEFLRRIVEDGVPSSSVSATRG